MIPITRRIALDDSELTESFTRSSGPGGQNVNKVETAVELRFDVANSPNLPDDVKARLTKLAGRRMTLDGVLIVTAQEHRSQDRNRAEAMNKLVELIREAAKPPPPKRKPTKPTKGSQQRRMDSKAKRGAVKKLRNLRPE
ncbi:alternative ribosome rescue aminoacyl-tRNA hydrolase ArfB [Magnetospirillum sp. 64-120]|uniref:alternative ribosome rescue aminoacyl-tRNA hydrolase ArfB n=1 Tax=Magnetospirillum sp. 64-120 TaxID=1895778 RepID=UPI000925CA4E|nr:alternative ribosome rescue aminoacyl-tRNA hydrolase ArfB [Magnetospirillum sp. 64-120]OJX70570.1 MAG: aminoacyl-tRNA hydrolase [Magnetospirillum sp. 64-120]